MNAAEDLFLVGNGEISNHAEIRTTLPGVAFGAKSDNEVALHLFGQRGPDAFSKLQGMYAFVIAGEDGRFVAARDPVGIKPLYWARRDGQVRFASEMRAFACDWQSAVESFPSGHYWTPEDGLVCFATPVPHDMDDREPFDGPTEPGAPIPQTILQRMREQFIQTVEGQMTSDVPVGVFLSGGLDSSLVAWLPDDLLWRKKAQFGDASGAASALQGTMAASVTEAEFARERHDGDPALRTREELAYYRIFKLALSGIKPRATIGRWVRA